VVSSAFDLVLNMQETPTGLGLSVFFNTDIFKPETIHTLTNQYKRVLNTIVSDPSGSINSITLTDAEESMVQENDSLDYDFNF
jgi:hypothetical protein